MPVGIESTWRSTPVAVLWKANFTFQYMIQESSTVAQQTIRKEPVPVGISRTHRLAALVFVLMVVGTLPGYSQTSTSTRIIPTNNAVLTGYGTVGYGHRSGGAGNAFNATFAPIFLWQFQDRFLFAAELEFEIEDGVTETGLEYAQLDMILTDNATGAAGKFLLPFGTFGDRLHPTWINKFPSTPPIYGHGAGFGAEPLLPVLADIGVMAKAVMTPGRWSIGLNGYVTQGAQIEGEADGTNPPEVHFPASSGDNNSNKMMGGRLDVALPPWMEVSFSGFSGKYDPNNVLDFSAWNIAAEARASNFEFRGEYVQTRQEYETTAGFPLKIRNGLYAQGAYRWRDFEPVVRWTQAFNSKVDGVETVDGASQFGFSLSYWFTPSLALMAGYEINRENGTDIDNDRFITHVAFGF